MCLNWHYRVLALDKIGKREHNFVTSVAIRRTPRLLWEGRERGAGLADREKVRKITFFCAAKHRKMCTESAIV
jgi:hypothetical protein